MIELSPEAKQIREQLEEAKKQYAELFAQREQLITYNKSSLLTQYAKTIGPLVFEIYTLNVESQRFKHMIMLAQAAINRNEVPNQRNIEQTVDEQLKQYYQEIKEQEAQLKSLQGAKSINEYEFKELKELYRTLVKKLHPDLHPNQSEAEHDLFIQVQSAYKNFNLQFLRDAILKIDIEVENERNDNKKLLATLEERITHIKSEIDKLLQEFPFNYKDKLFDQEWVEREIASLENERNDLREQITKQEETYKLILTWHP